MSDDHSHDHDDGVRDDLDPGDAAPTPPSDTASSAHTAPESDAEQPDPHDDGVEVEFDAPPQPPSSDALTILRVTRNMNRRGVLRIHHTSRDIDLAADGFNALRVVAHFGRQGVRPGLDTVSPLDSDADNAWTALDYSGVVAITWIPDRGVTRDGQVVFDPN